MQVNLIKIGHGNLIASNRIVDILKPESLKGKKVIQQAKILGRLINANYGRKTKSIIITDNDYVILCSINLKNIRR
ncbi:DUF370 domain-containing protein [Clostridium sp. SHJSY1]|uniref:extracellular matrix/biofilm biosynthesis regulator RemA family protein n=1 Tax=Clostridium sp. SHJSY1 TaxID=2942483 RepID=UPI002876EE2F|nr:extracellular matrix/biofilm biosynthesis regulator RemA family protein [Clostridium sp. SHJSY1]MDS0525156.1 DUF370 domain-containing protein [Clostridium sp. SHJSY1]